MQIKRFEAADMTEALRMVKREFGDEAVILSAKEVRPRGFFSALRKKHVEIRAATDYPAVDQGSGNEFSGLLARQLDDVSSTDRVSLSTSSAHPKAGRDARPSFGHPLREETQPMDRGGREVVAPPWPGQSAGIIAAAADTHHPRRRAKSVEKPVVTEGTSCEKNPPTMVAVPFFHGQTDRNVIALIGPPGSGKSSTVAKLAWRCRVVEGKRVGLISLDRFRIAANSVLKRVSSIMNLPLAVVHDAEEMQSAMIRLGDVDVVLIDTPGIGRSDRSMMDDVGSLLRHARPDETHLVVNATVRDEVFATTVDTFLPVGADRLLLTHWDENTGRSLMDVLDKYGLPASFLSDGVDLFDDLKTTTGGDAAPLRSTKQSAAGRVTAFPGSISRRPTEAVTDPAEHSPHRYLANRNSELFHQPTCKSVKRINTENIAAFDSIEQAINDGFKPCRACCDVSMIRQAAPVDSWKPRARAM